MFDCHILRWLVVWGSVMLCKICCLRNANEMGSAPSFYSNGGSRISHRGRQPQSGAATYYVGMKMMKKFGLGWGRIPRLPSRPPPDLPMYSNFCIQSWARTLESISGMFPCLFKQEVVQRITPPISTTFPYSGAKFADPRFPAERTSIP